MMFSLYSIETGAFTGGQLGGDPDFIRTHTPDGCGAWPGEHDHLRVRLDIAAGELVAYQPPSPAAHAHATWEWDEAAWRWVAVPTEAALAFEARAERDRRIAASDWLITRATETGAGVPQAWLDYRQALRDISHQPGFPTAITWPEPPQ